MNIIESIEIDMYMYNCELRYVRAEAIAIGKARNMKKFSSTLKFTMNISEYIFIVKPRFISVIRALVAIDSNTFLFLSTISYFA